MKKEFPILIKPTQCMAIPPIGGFAIAMAAGAAIWGAVAWWIF